MASPKYRRLRLDQLNLPQPGLRSERRMLDELVASVEEVGVVVPLVVRPVGKNEYAVIAGAGRLEALRRTGAGPATLVPCVIVEVQDAEAILLSLVENTVREPMRPFDEAEAARVLVRDYGFTQARVAKAIGVTPPMVSQLLAVFELDKSVVAARRYGKAAIAPLRYAVSGAGRVDARTTRSGKLKVVLEAEDRAGLAKLWRSFKKKLE